MKIFLSKVHPSARIMLLMAMFTPLFPFAANNWPKEIKSDKATIVIYQPQPDSMIGDHLYTRAAVSLTTPALSNPVFGAIWTDARFGTDRESGTGTIYDVIVLNVRFPGIDTVDPAKVQSFKKLISEEAKSWQLDFSLDEIKSTLAANLAAMGKSSKLKNDPPEIIYEKQKSVLVLLDGDPVLKEVDNTGLKRIINTPYLILSDPKDNNFYLYGGEFWYVSSDPVKSAWKNVDKPSAAVKKYFHTMQAEMKKSGKAAPPATMADGRPVPAPKVVVRTKPAELLQSDGEPSYAPIQGTQLLYMTNTTDNIFMTTDKNLFFVLLSGRWYNSAALTGSWSYVDQDQLPPDFAKIPEGSEKDIVLASVAGTEAAKEAVMDAQIPQTATVDRKTAKCEVKYDGDPKFETIKGTELSRAMNTSSTVLLHRQTYYVCDNAIWFTGNTPVGPWTVATSVPGEVQKIPPEDPAYNVKYVYIYDVQPEVVYVGYTPGYTGCYIYGPTVVYGTGFYYPPFYGPYYYPRPVTYGFSMHYNPYYGWSMGFSVSSGMFTFSVGGYPGGYWGPPAYRGGGNTISIDNSRNMYVNRGDNSTRPVQRPAVSTKPAQGDRQGSTRPSTQPSGKDRAGATKPSVQPADKAGTRETKPADRSAGQVNNVFTDRNGDVYRNDNGNWQKNNGKNWEPARAGQSDRNREQARPQGRTSQPATRDQGGFNRQEMDLQNSARQRGSQNSYNRSSMQRSSPGGGSRTGGSGMRR